MQRAGELENYYAELTRDSDVDEFSLMKSDVYRVTEGASYTVSIDFLDSDSTGESQLIYEWLDETYTQIAIYEGDYTIDSPDWQTLSNSETAPVDAKYLRVIIQLFGNIGSTVAVDNAMIIPD